MNHAHIHNDETLSSLFTYVSFDETKCFYFFFTFFYLLPSRLYNANQDRRLPIHAHIHPYAHSHNSVVRTTDLPECFCLYTTMKFCLSHNYKHARHIKWINRLTFVLYIYMGKFVSNAMFTFFMKQI